MSFDRGQVLERVAAAVAGLPVVAAYVFGSVARGDTIAHDLDVAVVPADGADAPAVLDAVARRLADVGEVDVVDLRRAPLRLAGRILTEGRLAASVDEAARVRFEATTRSLFFDFAPFAEASDRAYLAAVAEGRA
ncbi:MAG TPA: nucleotidyltransferase domain-containing protein [Acidimicrobiales bacterium]|nr:nucleotidyltransferase domain-containing protein [Acidimicrobiales bacterium]